jgi:tetratricopeptide (TPR) repeat protein
MRIFIIPNSTEDWVILLTVLALVIGIGIGVTVWQRLWPPATKKLLEDDRYHQALAVYAGNLPAEEPTRDDRRSALAAATLYLVNEHGIDSREAAPNVRLVVAAYDRDQSYELRHEGLAYEEAGDPESALAYYERAARLQEEHDPKDYQFLLRCADRVRRKVRSG